MSASRYFMEWFIFAKYNSMIYQWCGDNDNTILLLLLLKNGETTMVKVSSAHHIDFITVLCGAKISTHSISPAEKRNKGKVKEYI